MSDTARHDADLLDLAYPYALDAVADIERRHIESRLCTADPATRRAFTETVRSLHDVLAHLAVLDEYAPPPELEAQILARLGEQTEPRRSALRRGLRALAPVAAVVLLVLGGAVVADRFTGAPPALEQPHHPRELRSAPLTGGGTMTVDILRPGVAAVMFDGLAAPPPGGSHQLWLITPAGQARSIGVPAETPSAAKPFVTRFESGDTLAITVEPAGGSPAPTGAPLAGVSLP